MQRITVAFTIFLFILFALDVSAQPMSAGEPIQPKAKPTTVKVIREGETFELELKVPHQVVILPTIQGNLLYAFVNDALHALDADTGEIQWSFSEPSGFRFALVSDDMLYCVSQSVRRSRGPDIWYTDMGQSLYALDSQTGELRWQQRDVWQVRENLVLVLKHRKLSAFEKHTGEKRWETTEQSPDTNDTPLPFFSTKNRIYARYARSKDKVAVIDAETGQKQWEFTLPTVWGKLTADDKAIYWFGLMGYETHDKGFVIQHQVGVPMVYAFNLMP